MKTVHVSMAAGTLATLILVATYAFAGGSSPNSHHSHNTQSAGSLTTEKAFLADHHVAMNRMLADMVVKPTGNIDRDFLAMMIPHHQGAIDMALSILKYGRNERVKRLAQEIIIEQQQEIQVMKMAMDDLVAPGTGSAQRQ